MKNEKVNSMTALKLISSLKSVSLATQGVRLWNTSCNCTTDKEGIAISTNDFWTLRNIQANPRAAFTGKSIKGTISGNGLIRKGKVKGRYTLVPYRINLLEGRDNIILERLRSGWTPISLPVHEKRDIKFWFKAARSVTFSLSLLPVLTGILLSVLHGHFDLLNAGLTVFGVLFMQFGINFISDYHDFKKGIDHTGALSSHPGSLVGETIEPEKILYAALFCFVLCILCGFFLVTKVDLNILIFGLIGVAGGYFYTGGPKGLKYAGLGEILVGLLYGPFLMSGAYYVQARQLSMEVLFLSITTGCLVAAITSANNLRDMSDDKEAGITTLPMRIGIIPAKVLYTVLSLVPYVVICLFLIWKPPLRGLALTLVTIPIALSAVSWMLKSGRTSEEIRSNSRIHPYPLYSIRLHLAFNLAMLAGLGISFLLSSRLILG